MMEMIGGMGKLVEVMNDPEKMKTALAPVTDRLGEIQTTLLAVNATNTRLADLLEKMLAEKDAA